jgi:hypothetical protein
MPSASIFLRSEICHRPYVARAGHGLDQNVLSFAIELGGEQTDAGDVPARARK